MATDQVTARFENYPPLLILANNAEVAVVAVLTN